MYNSRTRHVLTHDCRLGLATYSQRVYRGVISVRSMFRPYVPKGRTNSFRIYVRRRRETETVHTDYCVLQYIPVLCDSHDPTFTHPRASAPTHDIRIRITPECVHLHDVICDCPAPRLGRVPPEHYIYIGALVKGASQFVGSNMSSGNISLSKLYWSNSCEWIRLA